MQPPDNGLIDAFLDEERLPSAFRETITHWYQPLAERLLVELDNVQRPLIVGINGAQGTGKSTLAKYLTLMLRQRQLRIANLSLDDFYLDSASRKAMADRVHPLLVTRGVPGTHDLKLANRLLNRLADGASRGQEQLPRFDKSVDEPRPRSEWETIELPVHVVVLEGWFVGLLPQADQALESPVNPLEAREDPQGTWRRFVNKELAAFQILFHRLDFLVMLKAPSFDCVYQWRSLQEQKLAARSDTDTVSSKIMDEVALHRFIQHFERLTRHCLEVLPDQADLVFFLDEQHRITHSRPDSRQPGH